MKIGAHQQQKRVISWHFRRTILKDVVSWDFMGFSEQDW
jgi:hypothetical protein